MARRPEREIRLSSSAAPPRSSPAIPGGREKFCTQCGFALITEAKFCARCGKPVKANSSPPPASAPERQWGPLNIHLFGRLLPPEAASLIVLASVLAAAVLLLGGWKFMTEPPPDTAPQQTAQSNTAPSANSIPNQNVPSVPQEPPNVRERDTAPLEKQPSLNFPPVPTRIAAPTITSFHFDRTSIESGESANLIWSAKGASSVAIEPGIGVLNTSSGEIPLSPPETTSYRIIAKSGGGSVESRATINVLPVPAPAIVAFSASPAVASPGQSVQIQWQVTGKVANVSLDPGFTNLKPEGVLSLVANSTTSYSLRAQGPGGTTIARVLLEVSAPVPAIVFRAEPATITQGESTVLHWQAPSDAKVTLEPGGVFGVGQAISSVRVKPLFTTTYTLNVDSLTVHDVQRMTVLVNPRSGPSTGDIEWNGLVHNVQIVSVERDHADVGTLRGALPGVPCIVQPADEKRVSIASAPGPRNNFDRMVIRVTGNGTVRAVIKWSLQ